MQHLEQSVTDFHVNPETAFHPLLWKYFPRQIHPFFRKGGGGTISTVLGIALREAVVQGGLGETMP